MDMIKERKTRKLVFLLIFLVLILIGFVVAQDSEIMTVEANISANVQEPFVSIEVPDYLFFGNLTRGGETDKIKVDVKNTGNVNVTITPQLANASEVIFSYLEFQRRVAEPWERIGEWSLKIKKPSKIGGFEDEYFYVKLDLGGYPKDITEDIIGHRAEVIFWAVES